MARKAKASTGLPAAGGGDPAVEEHFLQVAGSPPKHAGDELLITLANNADAVYTTARVWVSPGECAWVPTAEATQLIADGKARAGR